MIRYRQLAELEYNCSKQREPFQSPSTIKEKLSRYINNNYYNENQNSEAS